MCLHFFIFSLDFFFTGCYERSQIALLIGSGLSPLLLPGKSIASNTVRAELLRGSVPQTKNGKAIAVYFPDAAKRK